MRLYETHFIHCNTCGKETAHFVHVSTSDFGEGDEEYNILRCAGCTSPTLRWTGTHANETFEHFFPRAKRYRHPEWAKELPSSILSLLLETYEALNEDLMWLSAMGLRSLVDAFAVETVGDTGGFKAKMLSLQSAGLLSDRDAKSIYAAIELGHDATHRGRRPDLESCLLALRIVEHLLQRFAITKDAESLDARRLLAANISNALPPEQ